MRFVTDDRVQPLSNTCLSVSSDNNILDSFIKDLLNTVDFFDLPILKTIDDIATLMETGGLSLFLMSLCIVSSTRIVRISGVHGGT